MRVLLVSSGSGSRGGGEIFLDYLGRGLASLGHEVVIWLPKHARMDELAAKCSKFSQVLRSEYVNTYDYLGRSITTYFNSRASHRLAREWIAVKPDIVHINKQNLEDGLDLLRAATLSNLPSVCTIHLTQSASYLGAKLASIRDWIARLELRKFGGVFVAVQEKRRRDLEAFLPPGSKTKTILNGTPFIDVDELRPLRSTTRSELGILDNEFLVISVGRLVDQKRPFFFLRIAKDIHDLNRNTRFLWVGDGQLRDAWQNEIRRSALEKVVLCTGWKSDVTPFLLAADLMLHVAKFEGLPLALIEAMSAGLPCAVTPEFALEAELFNSENVLFIDDAKKLSEMIQDKVALNRIASAGQRLVREILSIEAMASSYLRLYEGAIADNRRPEVSSHAKLSSMGNKSMQKGG